MSEKPLHVMVAEALGTVNSQEVPPWHFITPRYDTDWSATGPLIEKYEITVMNCGGIWDASIGYDAYGVCGDHEAGGSTPLVAVCNLLLALHAAGKL